MNPVKVRVLEPFKMDRDYNPGEEVIFWASQIQYLLMQGKVVQLDDLAENPENPESQVPCLKIFKLFFGESLPSGSVGDGFINTETGQVFQRTVEGWDEMLVLALRSFSNRQVFFGSMPSLGSNGDVFCDSRGNWFQMINGQWVEVFRNKPQAVYVQPTPPEGSDGDVWFNPLERSLNQQVDGQWRTEIMFALPPVIGMGSELAPTGGRQGDLWFSSATRVFWIRNSLKWEPMVAVPTPNNLLFNSTLCGAGTVALPNGQTIAAVNNDHYPGPFSLAGPIELLSSHGTYEARESVVWGATVDSQPENVRLLLLSAGYAASDKWEKPAFSIVRFKSVTGQWFVRLPRKAHYRSDRRFVVGAWLRLVSNPTNKSIFLDSTVIPKIPTPHPVYSGQWTWVSFQKTEKKALLYWPYGAPGTEIELAWPMVTTSDILQTPREPLLHEMEF